VKTLKMTMKRNQKEYLALETKYQELQQSLRHTKVIEMEIELRTYFQEVLS
jgi:hypothetical protein